MPLRTFLALLLSTLLVAQQDAPPSKLNIIVIEGDGAINNVKQRVTREPIVQVEDENRKPVAGAVVAFTLPSQGASGTFTNGARILTVTTDQNGRAVMSGMRANNIPGKMDIRVNASHRGQTATTTITATNVAAVAGAAAGTATLITVLAVVGGAAAAGIAVAATRGNGNGNGTPATTPTVVSPGAPTVGPPR